MNAPTNLARHGYQPLYHGPGERCPGCDSRQWHVGRTMAECAMCETAIPLADVSMQPMEPRFLVTRSKTAERVPEMQGEHA